VPSRQEPHHLDAVVVSEAAQRIPEQGAIVRMDQSVPQSRVGAELLRLEAGHGTRRSSPEHPRPCHARCDIGQGSGRLQDVTQLRKFVRRQGEDVRHRSVHGRSRS